MAGAISPNAGKLLGPSSLLDVTRLVSAYYTGQPDAREPGQRVSFGTSGHRGSSLRLSLNESHVQAISQAICDYRRQHGIDGPLFAGIDTHALSWPALATALEVFVANGVEIFIDQHDGYTPTPVISHAILAYNRGRTTGLADGIVITPSHNPPEDGGYKYNPPHGGPAGGDVTGVIEKAANAYLANGGSGVTRIPYARARASAQCHAHDYVGPYVEDLANIVDMDAIRGAGVKIGIDPLGGASAAYWPQIIARYGLAATLLGDAVDPTFRFIPADWDGQIRMDCSSPYAMTRLAAHAGAFDVAFATDTDADRHGIVAAPDGLINPNHYLVACIDYLFANRPGWSSGWPGHRAVGKTIVSSSLIDRVVARRGGTVFEVPVGFKWFADGLHTGALGFAGEESGGASFLRRDGSVWTTDKDGLILGLLAAEMTARDGRNPCVRYRQLTEELGVSYYERTDAPATPTQKAVLLGLSPDQIGITELAGEPIMAKHVAAPGNNAPIGGLKIASENGWFAVRPSGTEDIFKIYAESFRSRDHLRQIQLQAGTAVSLLLEMPT